LFLVRIKSIRTKNKVSVNNKDSVGFLYKIADCERMVFIRARSAIRADVFSSAQHSHSTKTGAGDLGRHIGFTNPDTYLIP